MNNGDNKPVFEIKNNLNVILKCFILIISFIFGCLLMISFYSYIKNITILKTFFILLSIYLFQLFFETFKISMLHCNKIIVDDSSFKFKLFLNKKFLFVNLMFFLFCLFLIFLCLILGIFFNKFEILFNIIMGVGLGIIYLFYTIELFKLMDYTFEGWVFKRNKYDFLYVCLINSLAMTFIISLVYLSI